MQPREALPARDVVAGLSLRSTVAILTVDHVFVTVETWSRMMWRPAEVVF